MHLKCRMRVKIHANSIALVLLYGFGQLSFLIRKHCLGYAIDLH